MEREKNSRESDFLRNLKTGLGKEVKKKRLLHDVLSDGWLPSEDRMFREKVRVEFAGRIRIKRVLVSAAAVFIIAGVSLVFLFLSPGKDTLPSITDEQQAAVFDQIPEQVSDEQDEAAIENRPRPSFPAEEAVVLRTPDPETGTAAEQPAELLPKQNLHRKRTVEFIAVHRNPIGTGSIGATVSRSSKPVILTAGIIEGDIREYDFPGYTLASTDFNGEMTNAFLIKSEPEPQLPQLLENIRFETMY